MKNFIQMGDVLDYTNAGSDISAGAVVVIEDRIGVAVTDIPNGETGAIRVRGVVELAKDTGAMAQGKKVYWVTDKIKTSGTVVAGFVAVKAESGDTTVRVSLNA